MMTPRRFGFGVVALVLGGTLWGAAGTAPPVGGMVERAGDLAGLAGRLGNEDFAVREKAQQELEKLPTSLYGELQALAQKTGDEEAKGRLLVRVKEMREEMAVDPLPITLHVKDATAAELAKALSGALGEEVEARVHDLDKNPKGTFTLDVENAPYWEVYSKLSEQHFLELARPLERGLLNRLRTYQRYGPFVVYQAAVQDEKQVRFQEIGGTVEQSSWSVSVQTAVDPRVRVAQSQVPLDLKLTNEKGETVAEGHGGVSYGVMQASVQLPRPPKAGEKLFAEGKVEVTMEVSVARKEIDDLEKHVDEKFEFGQALVSVSKQKMQGNAPRLAVTTQVRRAMVMDVPGIPAPAMASEVSISCVITDADGQLMAGTTRWVVRADTGAAMDFPLSGKSPYKAVITASAKTKPYTFEFKLPLVTE